MLERLYIENYALIEKTDIEFPQGFTVITGETGAGKSIMLGALSLLMGARADSKVVTDKERKTIVEAHFTSPDLRIKDIFDEEGLDWEDDEIIVRREITSAGKSRGFVNDTPVNLNVLSSIAEKLIDIHSQHSNSILKKPGEQLSILDAFGNLNEELRDYRMIFREYVALRNKIKKAKEAITTGKENLEYIKFRLEHLDKLKPKKGELEVLEREFEILNDADRISANLGDALNFLGSGEESALSLLHKGSVTLDNIDNELLDPEGNSNLKERVDTLKIELRDIVDTLEGYMEKVNSDPERLEKVRVRIENLYESMKRFKVKDDAELVELHENLRKELASITGEDTDFTEMESQLKELAKRLKDSADHLSAKRREAAEKFSDELVEKISPLGLPNIKFEIDIKKGKLSVDGQDAIVFMCSFNLNHPMQPVSEIASGGEISRVMLGIKSVMTENMHLPTIIFDEVDTGVSGEIAHKMGKMMKEMSRNIQVMSVTHLPQVAANGDSHLKVYKKDEGDKTVSNIRMLKDEERVSEIAAMLSATEINEAALENARILLEEK